MDFVYSATERQHFEKRSTFLEARLTDGRDAVVEVDHELVWMLPSEAEAAMAHPSHRWAVSEFRRL